MTNAGPASANSAPLVEHFFRHEAGRLVSVLTRVFGWKNFDLVEDVVQATLLDALSAWRVTVPDNPSAWVHRVARNKILDALRRDKIGQRAASEWSKDQKTNEQTLDDLFLDTGIEDSQLRMMFACCHPHLARENQVALTLKTLCGFGNAEIGHALLTNEDTVKQRLHRATKDLAERNITLDPAPSDQLPARLEAVHQVLYLLFNEGYSASKGDAAIRADLCEEAVRLCMLLCSNHHFSAPSSYALLGLMTLHAARLDARVDEGGFLLLIGEQDRSKWDRNLIRAAEQFLNASAEGEVISVYHLEAAIAYHHCQAKTYSETNWRVILSLYDVLLGWHRSPVYLLNRAIVLAELEGPEAALQAMEELGSDPRLRNYHLHDATLGELNRRLGRFEVAKGHLESARKKTNSRFDHEVIDRMLAKCVQ